MVLRMRTFFWDDEGEVAVSYGLLAALIALAMIVGVESLGLSLSNVFDFIDTSTNDALNRHGFFGNP